jgi:hypothetical protein
MFHAAYVSQLSVYFNMHDVEFSPFECLSDLMSFETIPGVTAKVAAS